MPWPRPLPEWTNIKQYLKYLNLDEPIIGLSALVQQEDVVTEDDKVQLRYRCKICSVEMEMCTMVSHVVSRKHRQKYLQLKRPDLVTWQQNESAQKQPGLVARAKAALVEKQEGWGTPVVLHQPNKRKRLQNNNQGYGAKDSYTHETERSYSGWDRRGQSAQAEDSYRQSYLEPDSLLRPSHYPEDDLYDRSSREKDTNRRSYPEDNRYQMTYYEDGRQRSFQEDNSTKTPYMKGDISAESFAGHGRHHSGKISGRSHHDEHQDAFYQDINSRRGWTSNEDVQDDFYQGSVPKNKFNESGRSGSGQQMNYQTDMQIQDQLYTSHERRGHGRDEIQRPGKSFHYTEEGREHFHDVERSSRSGSFEVQGYSQRNKDDFGDYTQELVPTKRKRKSRFSDATPIEQALTQKRLAETMIPKKNPRRIPPDFQSSENRLDSENTNRKDVLDMLDEVKIQNMDEANFLKDKLTTLLKEFEAKQTQHVKQNTHVIRDYSHKSAQWMNQRMDMLEDRHVGFQEATPYDGDGRDFQLFQESSRDSKDGKYFKESRHIDNRRESEKDYHSAKYEKHPRNFQESRHYDDDCRGIKRGRWTEDKPRDFQRRGHFEDPRNIQNIRQPRDQCTESSLEHKHKFEWDAKRRGSVERSDGIKDYYPEDMRRACQERPWESTYLKEEENVFGENRLQRPRYQHDHETGVDLYDPFHPSSSPPQEVAPPSSLEKLASTLLELVARKSSS
ncbi:uncharacterized protein si:ch211-13c6.2 isoform X2 [Hoplias malabaricus]